MDKDIDTFYIYNYIDHKSKTYLSYIDKPDDDGVIRTTPDTKVIGSWYLADIFFTVASQFRPIPFGMKIFCAKRSKEFPYGTTDVQLLYDTYNKKNDCIYFTTYNKPVLNTQPLYFHRLGNSVFPSLNKLPPSENKEWTQNLLSPIFVMTPKTVGNKDKGKLKFNCVGGTCMPINRNIDHGEYDIDMNDNTLGIASCVNYCNKNIINKPPSLIQHIQNKNSKKTNTRWESYIKYGSIIAMVIILVAILVAYLVSTNKNEKMRYGVYN